MAKGAHFSTKMFKFLTELRVNNDRKWFEDNRDRYEEHVKGPLQAFIADVAPAMGKITKHVVADPKKSMFRIHRDVRFSKDKSPYKTHAAAQFRHSHGKDVHAPGFYLHLEPGSVFVGGGMWHPDSASLANIRAAIDGDQAGWKRITRAKTFKGTWELHGSSLKRPPKGYDADHPLIDDLKRKDFIVLANFKQKDATSATFLDLFVKQCKAASPFLRFLAKANDLPW